MPKLSLSAALIAAIAAVVVLLLAGVRTTSASLPMPASTSQTVTEDTPTTITLAGAHIDGEAGCTDLTFETGNASGGTLGSVSALPCADGLQVSADIDAVTTTIPVVTTTGFPESGNARIGNEIISYTAMTENSLTSVTRGAGGSTAAAHSAGAIVSAVGTATGLVQQNLSDVDSTLLVTGTGLGFQVSGLLGVGSEVMSYASWTEVDTDASAGNDATQFAVVRGVLASTAEAHVAGSRVFQTLANQTTISEDVNASQTTLPVVSTAGLAMPDGFAQIGSETMFYTGLGADAPACGAATPPCLTGVSRGARNTTAAAHSTDALLFQIATADTDTATVDFTPAADFFSAGLTLSADIPAGSAILPLTDQGFILGSVVPATGTVAIGDELVDYTAVGDTTLACSPQLPPCLTGLTRGAGGTTAAAHATSDKAYQAFFTVTAAHDDVSAPAVIGIDVTPTNDPPVAADEEVQVTPDTTQDITFSAADVDGDSGTEPVGDCQLGFNLQTPADHGTLGAIVNDACASVPPNTDSEPNTDSATIAYTPEAGFTGDDSIEVMVCDDGGCDVATVTIHVQEPTPSPSPSPSPTPVIQRADINCDFSVDVADSLAILEMIAGVPEATPIGCPDPLD